MAGPVNYGYGDSLSNHSAPDYFTGCGVEGTLNVFSTKEVRLIGRKSFGDVHPFLPALSIKMTVVPLQAVRILPLCLSILPLWFPSCMHPYIHWMSSIGLSYFLSWPVWTFMWFLYEASQASYSASGSIAPSWSSKVSSCVNTQWW